MTTREIEKQITDGVFDDAFAKLYGTENIKEARERYIGVLCGYRENFSDNDKNVVLFSAPGRTEICGNHTDHNCGRTVAAAVTLDIIAAAAPSDRQVIRIQSEGKPGYSVDITNIEASAKERGYASSLNRGICAAFESYGRKFCGYDMFSSSKVKTGGGLSSSAAFENISCRALSAFCNSDEVTPIEIAKAGQFAESEFFGKPSGLLDQTASAFGGFSAMDFRDPKNPIVKNINLDLTSKGYLICITETGGDHSDMTSDYAAITEEMRSVAHFFGKEMLRGITADQIMENGAAIRKECGDRAFMRALHFANEDIRATEAAAALENGDIPKFLEIIRESGRSSIELLQNIIPDSCDSMGLAATLAASAQLIRGIPAATRVHGGGFAGTIQAFIPVDYAEEYCRRMNTVCGEGSCSMLSVRSYGAVKLINGKIYR